MLFVFPHLKTLFVFSAMEDYICLLFLDLDLELILKNWQVDLTAWNMPHLELDINILKRI